MNHFTKIIRLALTSTILSFSICINTFAFSANDLTIHNDGDISTESRNLILNSLNKLPEDVLEYYDSCNGEIYLVDRPLPDKYNDYTINPRAVGLFFPYTNEISVRMDEYGLEHEYTVDHDNRTIVHEIGHFLYSKTYAYLDDSSKATAAHNYEYWKNYNPKCYNENETFAEIYSWYIFDMIDLDDDTINMYKDAEKICSILVENDIEPGPGTVHVVKDKK